MPTHEAEALAMQWKVARSARDYEAADGIRARLRSVGIEAEDLVQEIELFGLSGRNGNDWMASGTAHHETDEVLAADDPDPRSYRDHMSEEARQLFGPTEAASRHRDGGTGGLLTLNYSVVPDLPDEIGFKVTSGKAHASADALAAYKEVVRQQEEALRQEIADRNRQTLRVRSTG